MATKVGSSSKPAAVDERSYEIRGQQRAASDFITQSTLKQEFKLNDRWLARLGEPDKTAANPHYRTSAPMKLYRVERVMTFLEAHEEEYCKHLERHARRSVIARQVMDKRLAPLREERERQRREAEEWAYGAAIVLKPFPDDLYAAAREHYDRLDDHVRPLGPRAVVAMLRHQYTNYHTLLQQLHRLGDPYLAYLIIKGRVNAAVSEQAGIADASEPVSGGLEPIATIKEAAAA